MFYLIGIVYGNSLKGKGSIRAQWEIPSWQNFLDIGFGYKSNTNNERNNNNTVPDPGLPPVAWSETREFLVLRVTPGHYSRTHTRSNLEKSFPKSGLPEIDPGRFEIFGPSRTSNQFIYLDSKDYT